MRKEVLEELGIAKFVPQSCYVEGDWKVSPMKFSVSLAFLEDDNGKQGKEKAFVFADHSGLMNIHVLRKCSPIQESDFSTTSEVSKQSCCWDHCLRFAVPFRFGSIYGPRALLCRMILYEMNERYCWPDCVSGDEQVSQTLNWFYH